MKPKSRAQVDRALRVLEIATQEGVLFGKYGPLASALVGGIRGYLTVRNAREARALGRRVAASQTPKPSARRARGGS